MDAIIQIKTEIIGTEETNAVKARDLYRALEIKKDFSDWVKHQINSLGLDKNIDYIVFPQKGENLSGGRPSKEYILTLDAAKHIAMASRSAKGKEVRAYFIEVEKRYRNGTVVSAEQTQVMAAVLHSLQNISEVIQTLGSQMERLDRRLQTYEEREQYKREKARLRAERMATGNGMVGMAYEQRRKQFIQLIQNILRQSNKRLNQSMLLIKAGYRRDDKTARKWLGEGLGIYWRAVPERNALIYSIIESTQEAA